jgi:hypothetical protein
LSANSLPRQRLKAIFPWQPSILAPERFAGSLPMSLESAPPRSGLTIAQAGTSESRTEDPQASRGKAVESKK